VVASGYRYTSAPTTINNAQSWQREAWRYYDSIGELRYAANWVGNVLSRVTLYAAKQVGNQYVPNPKGDAADVLASFFGGSEGQSQALGQIGIHLFIAGECFLVERKGRANRGEDPKSTVSEVLGSDEVSAPGGKWQINYNDSKPLVYLDPSEAVIRIWRPHPQHKMYADSPVRAVLNVLGEIERLSQHILAQIISRLTGAGMLLLPQGLTFPTPEHVVLPDGATEADKVMATLFDAMTTAVQSPSAASAVAPIVLMVPEEFVEKANLIHFWSELDAAANEMRVAAIRRLGLGLDIPVEVLLGTADLNHWSAWQVDEASIKTHIEPVGELIVSAIGTDYVQAVTKDPTDVVRYDTSAVRLRPNRSKEAIELWDRGELSAEALRRETGFSEGDAPEQAEQETWLLKKVASGSATPEMVDAALEALGVDLNMAPMEQGPNNETPPPRSLRDHPEQGPPEEVLPPAASAGILAASEALVYRALERAGNRLRSLRAIKPVGVGAADVYLAISANSRELDRLMDDAWTCVPRVMKGIPFEQQQAVTAGLDAYVRNLLMSQKPHDPELMHRYLVTTPVRELS